MWTETSVGRLRALIYRGEDDQVGVYWETSPTGYSPLPAPVIPLTPFGPGLLRLPGPTVTSAYQFACPQQSCAMFALRSFNPQRVAAPLVQFLIGVFDGGVRVTYIGAVTVGCR
jgi:hypothetical protein